MKKLFFWSVLFFIVGSIILSGGDMSRQKLLYEKGNVPQYSGKDLATISFPIGGLGTGNINIGAGVRSVSLRFSTAQIKAVILT